MARLMGNQSGRDKFIRGWQMHRHPDLPLRDLDRRGGGGALQLFGGGNRRMDLVATCGTSVSGDRSIGARDVI